MRSILIDPVTRTITSHIVSASVESLREAVDGSIAFATELKTGDVLYVDDCGLLKRNPSLFMIAGGRHPYAGRGVLVGPEVGGIATDVHMTVQEVRQLVEFDVKVDLERLLTVRTTTFKSLAEALEHMNAVSKSSFEL